MNKFLIIQTASAGDVILATSLIESVHEHFPDAQIDFLLKKGNESLFEHHPYLKNIIIFDKKRHKLLSLFNLILKVRKARYDVIINVQRFFSSGLIAIFSRAKIITGFSKNPLSLFFTHRYPHQFGTKDSFVHEIDRNRRLIEPICSGKNFLPRLYPPRINLNDFQISQEFISISPGSLWFTKRLPAEKWIKLIKLLPENRQCVLLGGHEDIELCNDIADKFDKKKVINLAGRLSFLQTAALMKQALMNYTNDSAPLHLASAVNAPVCVVYCSTVPEFGFTPLSEKSVILEYKDKLYCRPCGLHGHHSCPEKHFKCGEVDVPLIL